LLNIPVKPAHDRLCKLKLTGNNYRKLRADKQQIITLAAKYEDLRDGTWCISEDWCH
jgi:hypothetical protein